MSDLWEDEGFGSGGATPDGGEDDWDEGDESLDTALEDAFDDPEDSDGDAWDDDDAGDD
jgi:hypothetical protein